MNAIGSVNPLESPAMTASDVEGFLDLTAVLGVRVWLDGGWAVDACLGEQSRRHEDLDRHAYPRRDPPRERRDVRDPIGSRRPRNARRARPEAAENRTTRVG
jgi:hypothetical protein